MALDLTLMMVLKMALKMAKALLVMLACDMMCFCYKYLPCDIINVAGMSFAAQANRKITKEWSNDDRMDGKDGRKHSRKNGRKDSRKIVVRIAVEWS
jgi:hypothetical protein